MHSLNTIFAYAAKEGSPLREGGKKRSVCSYAFHALLDESRKDNSNTGSSSSNVACVSIELRHCFPFQSWRWLLFSVRQLRKKKKYWRREKRRGLRHYKIPHVLHMLHLSYSFLFLFPSLSLALLSLFPMGISPLNRPFNEASIS